MVIDLQTELQNQEVEVAESRRQRERILESYRKKADEKKEFADKVEKRVQRNGKSIMSIIYGFSIRYNLEECQLCKDHWASVCTIYYAIFNVYNNYNNVAVSEVGDQNIQEEHEAKISNYEDAFAKIKDATGVSDIQVHVCVCITMC